MTINKAKQSLEGEIINLDGVIGIGIIESKEEEFIEIAILENHPTTKNKILELCPNKLWKGYKIKVIISKPYTT